MPPSPRVLAPALVAVLSATVLSVAAPLRAGDWPQHRGGDGSGVATGAGVFPTGPFALEVVWRRPLGSGYAAVSVSGDVAVTAAAAGEEDVVVAFDARTGAERWRAPLGPVYRGHDGSHDGPIATPAAGAGRVHVLGPRGRLATFDLANGRELWSLDLAAREGAEPPTYGFGVSPVLAGGTLVVAAGGKPAILGLDPATGALRWASGDDRFTYQTPLVGDGETVLVGGNGHLVALDAASGRLLWQHEHGGGWALGAASLIPVQGDDGAVFLKHSGDGSKAIRAVADGDGVRVEELWSGPSIRGTYATPVLWEGSLYGYAGRFLTAVDWATGASHWRSREPGDGFLALADGRLVIATKEGSVHVGQASPAGWVEEAGLDVFADYLWTAPAIADGAIFVRSLGEVARLEARPVTAPAAVAGPAAEPSAPGVAGEGVVARFLPALAAAAAGERPALIDAFFATHGPPPVVEGDTAHFFFRGEAKDVAIEAAVIDSGEDVPMTRVAGSDLFHWAVRLEPAARTSYAFVVDFERRPDPANPRLDGEAPDQVSWMAMPAWREPAYLGAMGGELAGRLETHELPAGEGKRTVEVYLPPGYDAERERRYPVLVVHDGQEARAQGRLDHAFDALVRGGAVAPFLAFFVHPLNGGELYRASTAYLAELGTSVLPWLDSTYRTVPGPAGRVSYAAGGASAIALTAAWTEEPLFAGAALQSPFVLTSDEADVVAALRSRDERPLVVYFDWGRYDWRSESEAWNTVDASRRLASLLRDAGYRPGGGELPEGPGWWAWRSRLEPLLATFFPPSSFPPAPSSR